MRKIRKKVNKERKKITRRGRMNKQEEIIGINTEAIDREE